MIRLLLETATEVCSVAVARNKEILAEVTSSEAHQHSSHLTLFIQRVMAEAGLKMKALDEVVLSDGPGSYTSLRVGAATAKGLCLALPGLRLRVVPTLLSVTVLSRDAISTLSVLNSRKGEVFGQFFGAGAPVRGKDQEAEVDGLWTSPQNIRLTEEGWFERLVKISGGRGFHLSGPGQQRVLDHLPEEAWIRAIGPEHCSAVHLLAPAAAPESSRLVDIASYEPFYLNPPFVTKSKKKLLG